MKQFSIKLNKIMLVCFCVVNICSLVHADKLPLCSWIFEQQFINDGVLKSQNGPNIDLGDGYLIGDCQLGQYLDFWGLSESIIIAEDIKQAKDFLPIESMTVTAWVNVVNGKDFGGIIGLFQDNGSSEQGWILGYDKSSFTFGLSTKGADDGNGKMTYLKGKTEYCKDEIYFVVASYDGKQMKLYVNGQIDAVDNNTQSGPIHYPAEGKYAIAGYRDKNENQPHEGSLHSVSVYNFVSDDEWVMQQYSQANPDKIAITRPKGVMVEPYLQYVTKNSITVKWETEKACIGQVVYGQTGQLGHVQAETEPCKIHEVKLIGLKAETQYFYRVESKDNTERPSQVYTFQTAVNNNTPFAFAVFGDTQDHPEVCEVLAHYAWTQRPNFCVHVGDLVGVGKKKSEWLDEFFPGISELISRVALIPVLGNHEENARHYYNYMALPEPEYYYQYSYGNAQFFMIDSNKDLSPDSEQYKWLDIELAKSQAKWKIVCHHHPPYSSDENDFGKLWSVNKSTYGDLKTRQLTTLYDKYSVDIVWSGHIHSYERTWPIKNGQVVDGINTHGTIYMVTGGAGGHLETAGPCRNHFMNNILHGHHYCMVYINGPTLEFKAFDLDNHIFDQMTIVKN